MRNIVLLFLFISLNLFSQAKIEFVYKVTSAGSMLDSADTNYEIIKPYLEKMFSELDDLTYSLKIKNTESLWYLVDSKSYSDTNMGKVFGGDQTYYFDLKTKQYLEQRNFLDNYFLIQSPQKDFHWELIDESKQILGYTCKKAISKEIKTINGINKTFVTEAWYCPTLKYSIGPLNFGGLDGLILEMTNQKRKYYCTEILSDNKMAMFIIAKPKQGKVVTEEEFLIETKKIQEEKGMPFFKD